MSFFRRLFRGPDIPDDPFADQQQGSVQAINSLLDQMRSQSGAAMSRADMTTEQLFGEDIDRMRRSVRAGGEGSRRAVQRGAMARGGDTSGGMAASLLSIDQSTNRAIGHGMGQFTHMATGERARERQRTDSLLNNIMRGESGMLSRWDAKGEFERTLEIERDQANRQFWADMIGNVMDTAGTLATGGAE